MEEPVPEVPDFTLAPSYFPIHLTLRVNTDFTHTQFQREIDDKIQSLKKVTDAFLDDVAGTSPLPMPTLCEEFLLKQAEAYARLVQSKFRLQTLQNSLRQAHVSLTDSRRLEDDLSLDNYNNYCTLQKQNFADAILGEVEPKVYDALNFSAILKADSWYQYVRNAYFVLQHPEDPLPEDQDDDDVAVEGGKISLKDPLSLNYFVEPMMSVRCKHVYEKEHIMPLIKKDRAIQCPITGCNEEVTRADLLLDSLMLLRVKVHQAREKSRVQTRAARVN